MVYLPKDKEPDIRKVYNPSDKQKEILDHVYNRYRQMGDKRAKYEAQWDKWERQWECYRPVKDQDDWRSDIYIPITTSTVEAMMSEIVGQDIIPWAVERGAEDAPKATVINNIIEYTWDVAKSDVAMFDIIKDTLVLGTGVGQEYYWKDEREITLKDGSKTRVVEFEDCFLEPIKLRDFYVDERARAFFGPYAAQDCVRRYVMDIDAFRNFFKGETWDMFKVAQLVKPGGKTDYYEFFKPPERMNHNSEVEVLWYWNKPNDELSIVANDVLVVSKPNPYAHKQLPFARAIDVKRTHQFYGKGEAELLESLQEETNTLRRMIIDRNHLDIDKPVLVSDTLTMEDEDTIARPHGVIPVGDVNGAKFAEYSDIPKSVFDTLGMLNDDKIRVTGLDERQQSVSTAGTATEAAILKEATLKRLGMKIWQIKNDFLVDVGRIRVANIMQFYSQPKLEKIVGEKGTAEYQAKVDQASRQGGLVSVGGNDYQAKYRNIRLKDKAINVDRNGLVQQTQTKGFTFFEAKPQYFMPVNGGFDIRYKATSSLPISKPLQQQKVMEMYDRLIQNPTVDPWKLAEAVLKSQEFDPDEFKPQQPAQEQGSGDLQQLIELAGQENQEMLNGNPLASTPYASPAHSEIHIEFMKSKPFQESVPPDSPILQNFANHVTGELAAQQSRETGGMQMSPGGENSAPMQGGQAPPPNAQGGQNVQMAAAMPGKVQGGGQQPTGMRGAETGIQTGRKI